jgi:hypothetical protein
MFFLTSQKTRVSYSDVKMDFDRNIVSNDNGWEYGGFGKEMGESIERTLANLKESLGARLPNAPKVVMLD